MTKKDKKGRLVILSSPSGGGKSTICDQLKRYIPDVIYSISSTTRKPRGKEKDGIDYFFLSKHQFKQLIDQNRFAEWALVHGNYYGTDKHMIESFIKQGKICMLDIDIQGGMNLKKLYPDAVSIFIAPPSLQELEKRLRSRKTDNEQNIQLRLANAKKELEYKKNYDYIVVNDVLDETIKQIVEILKKI